MDLSWSDWLAIIVIVGGSLAALILLLFDNRKELDEDLKE